MGDPEGLCGLDLLDVFWFDLLTGFGFVIVWICVRWCLLCLSVAGLSVVF